MDRTGIPWRYLPHDFAPWATVYGYFAKWQQDGAFEQLTGLLRRLVREQGGRHGQPSACVLDSQTIKTSANVHLAAQGTDAGQRIIGRKRHLGCDTLGLLLAVMVTAATVSDTAVGIHLLNHIATAHPRIPKPGWTPATAPRPSITAPTWASASTPPNARRASSCTTADSPETTRPTRTARTAPKP